MRVAEVPGSRSTGPCEAAGLESNVDAANPKSVVAGRSLWITGDQHRVGRGIGVGSVAVFDPRCGCPIQGAVAAVVGGGIDLVEVAAERR